MLVDCFKGSEQITRTTGKILHKKLLSFLESSGFKMSLLSMVF